MADLFSTSMGGKPANTLSILKWAPLKTIFFRDSRVSSVLESSCIPLYTAVLRAVLPCSREKIQVFRGAQMLFVSQAAHRKSC